MSTRVVAVSPHLDDAVFSAGALLATLAADEDTHVEVATVFTASVPSPRGFALACQVDKGIPREVDYMALRRREDVRACGVLGVSAVHLGLPEAPHRGYDSASALFAGAREDDDVTDTVRGALAPVLGAADLILTCEGVGDHVDHVQVLRALEDRQDLVQWVDQPYGLRHGVDRGHAVRASSTAMRRKLDACAAYRSQLGFQFGGEVRMRRTLGASPERLTRDLSRVLAEGARRA